MSNKHVNIRNADRPGNNQYSGVIQQIQEDGVCPFCKEHLEKYHKNPILQKGQCWTVTTNMYPYENAKHHFLFILNTHKVDTKELSASEWQELHEHINWLVEMYAIAGGSLMMRCGNTSLTGASVAHLHAHFICADFENAGRKPIMVRVG